MIAISTAYKKVLVGVAINGKTAFKALESHCNHSENLLVCVDELLCKIDENMSQNRDFAVVIGPGSFTGLRISTALIKGFVSGGNGGAVVPITTFKLMAYSYIKNHKVEKDFTCMINGLSGYYFICKFDKDGNQLSEEKLATKDEIDFNDNAVCLEEESFTSIFVNPTAQELLELAIIEKDKGNLKSAGEISPLYLRKSQAEDSLELKEKK